MQVKDSRQRREKEKVGEEGDSWMITPCTLFGGFSREKVSAHRPVSYFLGMYSNFLSILFE